MEVASEAVQRRLNLSRRSSKRRFSVIWLNRVWKGFSWEIQNFTLNISKRGYPLEIGLPRLPLFARRQAKTLEETRK